MTEQFFKFLLEKTKRNVKPSKEDKFDEENPTFDDENPTFDLDDDQNITFDDMPEEDEPIEEDLPTFDTEEEEDPTFEQPSEEDPVESGDKEPTFDKSLSSVEKSVSGEGEENPSFDTGDMGTPEGEQPVFDNQENPSFDNQQQVQDIPPEESQPIEDPTSNISNIYRLKKIFSNLCIINDLLQNNQEVKYKKIRDGVNDAISLFKDILVPNFDKYGDRMDGIIKRFERFINVSIEKLNQLSKKDSKEE